MIANVIRERRNNVVLTVKYGELYVHAPLDFPSERINELLDDKKDWIKSKISVYAQNKEKYYEVFVFNETIFFGDTLPILYESALKQATLENRAVILPKKYEFCNDKKRDCLIKLILAKSKEILPQLIAEIGTRMSLCPSSIEVKMIRGKRIWGKCTVDKKIVIDSHVIQLPLELQQYIIIHEFCHFYALNHSLFFWSKVEQWLPDYKRLNRELKSFSFLREIY